MPTGAENGPDVAHDGLVHSPSQDDAPQDGRRSPPPITTPAAHDGAAGLADANDSTAGVADTAGGLAFRAPLTPTTLASLRQGPVPELESTDLRWGLPALKVGGARHRCSAFAWLVTTREALSDQWKRFISAFLAAQHPPYKWVRTLRQLRHSVY
jgi:hypothetical protein